MRDKKRKNGDLQKTKKELLEELNELRSKLEDQQASGERSKPDSKEPIFAGEVTRRNVLKTAWVAPVILSIPVAVTVGGARKAKAGTVPPTASPSQEPTASPSQEPTASPSQEPTASPSQEPTAVPTSAPSGFPSAVGVPALSLGGAAAAAGVLLGAGAKKLLASKREASRSGTPKDPKKKISGKDSESDDGSGSGGDAD